MIANALNLLSADENLKRIFLETLEFYILQAPLQGIFYFYLWLSVYVYAKQKAYKKFIYATYANNSE